MAFYWPAAGSLGHPFATDANNIKLVWANDSSGNYI